MYILLLLKRGRRGLVMMGGPETKSVLGELKAALYSDMVCIHSVPDSTLWSPIAVEGIAE